MRRGRPACGPLAASAVRGFLCLDGSGRSLRCRHRLDVNKTNSLLSFRRLRAEKRMMTAGATINTLPTTVLAFRAELLVCIPLGMCFRFKDYSIMYDEYIGVVDAVRPREPGWTAPLRST